jgi:Zn ribbon nucleic-acid-binding protein
MKFPELKICPSCEKELKPVAEGRENFIIECLRCGFFASTLDMSRADYLANFFPQRSVRAVAKRIADRSVLLQIKA